MKTGVGLFKLAGENLEWDIPTMNKTIILDSKRRGSFGSGFNPGDAFLREVNGGTITFRKLAPEEIPLLHARKVNGKWMGADIALDRQSIVESIREDREAR